MLFAWPERAELELHRHADTWAARCFLLRLAGLGSLLEVFLPSSQVQNPAVLIQH